MTPWVVVAALTLIVALAFVRIVRVLRRRAAVRRHDRDVQVWEAAYAKHGGAVAKFTGYDQAKAADGYVRWQRQTPTGHPWKSARQLQARARRATHRPGVVPMAARRRAGGGQ